MKRSNLIISMMTAVTMAVISMPANAAEKVATTPAGKKVVQKKTKESVPGQVKYNLDTASSEVKWTAGHLVGAPHVGKVKFKEGHFEVNKGVVTSGEAIVDLKSVTDEDLTDATYNKKLTDHLKSPDFFDVEKYPTAVFKIDSFSEVHNIVAGQPNAEVKGTLTMHGVTKPVVLKMFFKESTEGFEATGSNTLNRTQYGLKYNSPSFFDVKALGDKAVKDEFQIDLKLVARK